MASVNMLERSRVSETKTITVLKNRRILWCSSRTVDGNELRSCLGHDEC